MSLSIGIVGLPNVGKSTLFQALTKKQVQRENYPFCTIDPNVGVVSVPDKRVDQLAELTHSAKKIYTTIEFFDIAGLVKGAHKGEGLGNQFLAHIRETDAIIYVLRGFKNEKITNTQNTIDPLRDKQVLDAEMALKDLEILEKMIQNRRNDLKSCTKADQKYKKNLKELAALEKLQKSLENLGKDKKLKLSPKDTAYLKQFQFLSLKPRLYLFNARKNEVSQEIIQIFQKNHWPFVILDILEEFNTLDISAEERKILNLPKSSGIDHLIQAAYDLLNLITFFTTGEDETRAWTLKKGETAPKAGGVIHSDFEKKFIRAEIINWQDLINAHGFAEARSKGLVRTEGREYVIKDGDVIEIKI